MPVDFTKLTKLESMPASAAAGAVADRVVVLVKLRKGVAKPSFVETRTQISEFIFSAEIASEDLKRLEDDPGVESMAISRLLPSIGEKGS